MTPDQTRALLSALSVECADMGEAVDGLAALVLEHARGLAAADRAAAMVQAQAVDALSQRLAALAELTAVLSFGGPVDSAVDAVPLADLAARLRAAVSDVPVHSPAAGPAGGDLVLFD